MINIKKHVVGAACGLFTMIAATALVPQMKTTLVRWSGAVMPNSSRTEIYSDKPLRILSISGPHWATWDNQEDASAYHALVVLPVVVPEDSGSVSGGDGFTHRKIEMWHASNGQPTSDTTARELEINYDAIWRTITVDSHTYHLAKGNLFVVRFDQNWHPEVTQLNATFNKVADVKEVINVFKSVMSDDKILKQL